MENKIKRMIRYHTGINLKKVLDELNGFDLNNPEHIGILFNDINGTDEPTIETGQFYFDNLELIIKEYHNILRAHKYYVDTFKPDVLDYYKLPKFNSTGSFIGYVETDIPIHNKPVDIYKFLMNLTKVKDEITTNI